MKRLNLITKVVPVLKHNGKFIRNPIIYTESYIHEGEIVYGEMKSGEEFKQGKVVIKDSVYDFEILDKEINDIVWKFTNLFPGCLIKSIDGIRLKKKFFWDQTKLANRHWLSVNMMTEAYLGFKAFNDRKNTGKDVIDFIKYRQLLADGHPFDQELIDAVLPKPQN
jgi:6-oxo-cyclohex-1-ene-carbonyl-CoA hydrolase